MKINNQQEINCNRDMIDGCLNRMQITDNINEINMQASNLIQYLSKHISLNKSRVFQKGLGD